MLHTMVIGTTEPQDFQLYNDGAALVGTGLALGIEFRGDSFDCDVDWLSAAAGTVRVSNIDGVEAGKTYRFRFTLTDGTGKIGYCPNSSGPDEWFIARA